MSTTSSALALLREEPTLVGVVLHLVSAGVLRTDHERYGLPLNLVARFSGLTEEELRDSKRGPEVVLWGRGLAGADPGSYVTIDALTNWLRTLSLDRSDFAPAVPRALPGDRAGRPEGR